MNVQRNCLVAGLIVLASVTTLLAQERRSETLVRKQQAQQRIRMMARQLVGAVLDIQLQQLRENGLDAYEIYGDIQQMRGDLDKLIESEMPEVMYTQHIKVQCIFMNMRMRIGY